MRIESIGSPALWAGFGVFILAMLALDLGVFHRRDREPRPATALAWTGAWIALALTFALGLYWRFGSEVSLEFLTGYVMEKALSVDNLFVFLVVFSAFGTPAKLQHRVLSWGILGALVLRAVFIGLGAALLEEFAWVAYAFGALLVFLGIKLLIRPDDKVDPARSSLVRWFRRLVPVTVGYRGGRFTALEAGRRLATPLLLVLVAIEATDIVFALDSIPAVFAITSDPFIVFTSNIFAILGLRALYFALAGTLGKLRFLTAGLSVILVFVGAKMLVAGVYPISTLTSLGVVALVLSCAVVASLLWPLAPKKLLGRRSRRRRLGQPALGRP